MHHDEGTEADYMYDCGLADSGGDMDNDDPAFEVVGTRNHRMYCGSRSECWAFKAKMGGFVRPFSGWDRDDE